MSEVRCQPSIWPPNGQFDRKRNGTPLPESLPPGEKRKLLPIDGGGRVRVRSCSYDEVTYEKTGPRIASPEASNQKSEARSQNKAERGFTLMEILVAIAILAVVVTTILASFNSVFSTTEVLDDNSELYEMAKSGMKRIVLDLESIHVSLRPLYRPPELDQPPDPYRVATSNRDIGGTGIAQLRFTSRAHVNFEKSHGSGIAEITYYAQTGDDGQLVLKRSDKLYPYPPFEEKGSDPVLCKYVKSLAFKFYDTAGTEYEYWDSDSEEFGYATPATISVQLELSKNNTTHSFETMVSLPMHREKAE